MNKTLDMNKILDDMLNTSLSNCILSKLHEGNLVEDDATVYISYDNHMYYLAHAPYGENGEDIDKRTRRKIAKEFINKYEYADIVKIHKKNQKQKEEKISTAEENKKQLEELMIEYEELKQYGEVNVYANHCTISYYLEFKRNYDYILEIYPSIDGIYEIRYNYDRKYLTKEELTTLINNMIEEIKTEIKIELEKQKEELKQQNIYENKMEFAKEVMNGKMAIIKLKSSYQCLENGLRYTIGKGAGKFYSLRGVSNIVEYLDKKGITEYCFVSEDDIKDIDIKGLKNLDYKKF
ncbi:MAG: hypothetical protein SOZ95_05280 [Bacilli bacterium]|nr:hypothetical protein [Bacilli bacterium]